MRTVVKVVFACLVAIVIVSAASEAQAGCFRGKLRKGLRAVAGRVIHPFNGRLRRCN